MVTSDHASLSDGSSGVHDRKQGDGMPTIDARSVTLKMEMGMICRCCGRDVSHVFLDLHASPLANAFLTKDDLARAEPYYPLCVYVCDHCFLVQIDAAKASEDIFNSGYVYFSSCSEAFVRHAADYVNGITPLLGLNEKSLVVEAASNDGYLLQHFKARGIPCLGVEPSDSTANVAKRKGIDTIVEFFTDAMAVEIVATRGHADLFIGNNVVAHVPNLADFLAGIATLLKPGGTATLEFPHLLNLIRNVQFDTIYHEHFSYFSLLSIAEAMRRNGLFIYRVDVMPVHGGSLRIYCAKAGSTRAVEASVGRVLADEVRAGLDRVETYAGLQGKVEALCRTFIEFICREKTKGAKIAGYGAAAKGNTLLNYCGIKPYLIDFVADITPAKVNKFLPGSHIPVYGEEKIAECKPDYVVILPWNWEKEIKDRLQFIGAWDGKFVTAIPKLTVATAPHDKTAM
jgi:2-polyprenyl-3-methyl-5-hydroxy-6-metoxy-1,4-benzoquinol methylase